MVLCLEERGFDLVCCVDHRQEQGKGIRSKDNQRLFFLRSAVAREEMLEQSLGFDSPQRVCRMETGTWQQT